MGEGLPAQGGSEDFAEVQEVTCLGYTISAIEMSPQTQCPSPEVRRMAIRFASEYMEAAMNALLGLSSTSSRLSTWNHSGEKTSSVRASPFLATDILS